MILFWPVTSVTGWVPIHLYDPPPDLSALDLDADLSCHLETGYFFPAIRHWRIDAAHGLSTYAFALGDRSDQEYLRLRRSRFVNSVLLDGRKVARISDIDLARMVQGRPVLRVRAGDDVRVQEGDWAGMCGKVVQVLGGSAVVGVTMHSLTTNLTMAFSDLRPF